MFNPPPDLDESDLRTCLREIWAIPAESLSYRPVGFGSHHWLAAAEDRSWFVTVDDLRSRLVSATDTVDAAAQRLSRAFETARRLAAAGLHFVVGPVPATTGRVTARLDPAFSVVVHPFFVGEAAGKDGEYRDPRWRLLMAEYLASLHEATEAVAGIAPSDDLSLPLRDELEGALADLGRVWSGGPYSEPVRSLLADHAGGVSRVLGLYDRLAVAAGDASRVVITHGEPHAGNVLVTAGGLKLVDWESTRLALPERDLWDLDSGDGSVLATYERVSGRRLDPNALALCRLWYDLFEIAGYVSGFRALHPDDRNSAQSWRNLQFFLQPDERWPATRWATF